MTTLIGIRTNDGPDGIVIASDYQISEVDGNDHTVSTRPMNKIYTGPFWAMAHAGRDTRSLLRFYGVLKGYKRYDSSEEKARATILSAIDDMFFPEVRDLNTKLRKNGDESEDLISFLLAVNKPEVNLWEVDEFGNIKEPNDESDFDYICLGGGADKAEDHIKGLLSNEDIDRDKIGIDNAVYTARSAIGAAETEAGTGMGFGLTVLIQDDIREWGKDIRRKLKETEQRELKDIANYYLGQSAPEE